MRRGEGRVDDCCGRVSDEAVTVRKDNTAGRVQKQRRGEFPCGHPPPVIRFFEALVRGPVRGSRWTFALSGFRGLAPVSFRFRSDPVHHENFEFASFGYRFPDCCESSGAGSLSECFFSVLSFWGLAPPLKRTLRLFGEGGEGF